MDTRSKIRSGIFFGSAMAVFYILSHLITADQWTIRSVFFTVISGLAGGLVAGFLFGWILGAFVNSKQVEQSTQITPDDDETILFGSQANHLRGIESIGGKLYLTNKRLVFKSHNFNFKNEMLSIARTDIVSIGTFKSLGLIANGLSVTLKDHKTEKFIVNRPDEWTNWFN